MACWNLLLLNGICARKQYCCSVRKWDVATLCACLTICGGWLIQTVNAALSRGRRTAYTCRLTVAELVVTTADELSLAAAGWQLLQLCVRNLHAIDSLQPAAKVYK